MKQRLLLSLLFLLSFASFTPAFAQETNSSQESNTDIASVQLNKLMYVNAGKLNVRTDATTGAPVLLALKAPSQVIVLDQEVEWSLVSVQGQTGYVKSSYLVATLEDITVEDVDLELAQQNPEAVYVVMPEPTTKAKSTSGKPKSKGATVYFCNSGNTVKYHSSSSCRGLNRCSASVNPISLKEAQASMDACKICY
jgi:uncharacterized protein YgiM (DUF1202 family)